jgi:hypothetical protein
MFLRSFLVDFEIGEKRTREESETSEIKRVKNDETLNAVF